MKIKNIVMASLLALGVGATTLTVYAQAKYESPREALSGITGKSIEEIHKLRYEDHMAVSDLFETEADYETFKNEIFEQRKERVEDGNLSRERADEILKQKQDETFEMRGSGMGSRGNCTTGTEDSSFRNRQSGENHHGRMGQRSGGRR